MKPPFSYGFPMVSRYLCWKNAGLRIGPSRTPKVTPVGAARARVKIQGPGEKWWKNRGKMVETWDFYGKMMEHMGSLVGYQPVNHDFRGENGWFVGNRLGFHANKKPWKDQIGIQTTTRWFHYQTWVIHGIDSLVAMFDFLRVRLPPDTLGIT